MLVRTFASAVTGIDAVTVTIEVNVSRGIHDFNRRVTNLRVIKYTISNPDSGYELNQIRNQHTENQKVIYSAHDNLSGNDKFIILKYQFYPYEFIAGELVPTGEIKTGESDKMQNGLSAVCYLKSSETGFYEVTISTTDKGGNILRSSVKPFGIWVYPKEWDFAFYE
jgi:hypothetical protein